MRSKPLDSVSIHLGLAAARGTGRAGDEMPRSNRQVRIKPWTRGRRGNCVLSARS
jgi:hypothetical protein